MSLKSKLFFLVVGTLLMFALAVGSYFFLQSPIERMRQENAVFQRLSLATTELRAELNLLATSGFEDQCLIYRSSLANYRSTMAEMSQVTYLPTVNATLSEAVSSVANLKDLTSDGISQVDASLGDLEADAKTTSSGSGFSILSLLQAKTAGDNNSLLALHVNNLLGGLSYLNDSLGTTARVIKEKDQTISDEIGELQKQSSSIALIIVAVLTLVALLLALLITHSITRSFKVIDQNIALMSSGDFTLRFGSARRDEIGILGHNLDGLLETLNLSLSKIQAASRQNLERRTALGEAVSEATSSSVQIEANSRAIRSQMESMDALIDVSSGDIDNIMKALDSFSRAIGDQNHHMEESVAAVTEMLASIGNISRITENDRKAADALVHEAEQGREVFEAAFEQIGEITESVSAIQQMADVIAGIASQTNILAMNAAIEAAHAGEFGKGFAVVADEISKLAAAAATSSDEIAHTIKTIIVKITQAGNTRNSTSQAFDTISERIGEVSDSVREIHGNINEMQTGSRQILEAMQGLKEGSSAIAAESNQIHHASAAVQQVIGKITRVSHEVVANIGEIGLGLQEISGSIHRVSDQANGIGLIGTNLDEAIHAFRTTTS